MDSFFVFPSSFFPRITILRFLTDFVSAFVPFQFLVVVCNHVLRAAHGANWRAAPLLLPRFCHPVMQLFYPAFFRARFQKFFCSLIINGFFRYKLLRE